MRSIRPRSPRWGSCTRRRPRRPASRSRSLCSRGCAARGRRARLRPPYGRCGPPRRRRRRSRPRSHRRPAARPSGVTHDHRPVAVVTGANRGIGREVVRRLAAEGWLLVLGARDAARGRAAAAQLGGTEARVFACEIDVADESSVRAAAARVQGELGRCDALVNNAAIDYDTDARATSADLDRVHRAMETNLYGAWRTTLAFLPLLRRSPHPRLVNVSSGSGSLSDMGPGTPGYSVSKAALNALTRVLAAELRADGVLVNAVCPGWVATDMGGAGGRPVAEGAASVAWAVLLDDDGPTGGFFRDGRPVAW